MSSLLLRTACMAVAALLGGLSLSCVHYQARPIDAGANFDAFAARRLDDPEIQEFLVAAAVVERWPPSAWDLRHLTLAAFYYSPDMDVARARWGVTRAATISAGARPNPSLNSSLGYNSTSELIRPWIPEVVLGLPVETAGKRGIRTSQAQELSEAARLDVLHTAWVVRSRVRRAYLDSYRAHEMQSLLGHLDELQLQSLEVLDAQFEAGAVSAYELSQARIAAGRTRLAALEAARDGEQARIRLAEAMGVPSVALGSVEFGFEDLASLTDSPPTDDMRRQAVIHRADILSALMEYESIQSALRLEIAKQYPDLEIGAGYQLDQTDSKWTLGINLILPVFNRNAGPIAEAEAARTEAAARFTALQSQVFAEVDSAAASYRSAVQAVATTDEMLKELEQREALAQAAYRVGATSRLALLTSEVEIATGRIARLEALVAAQRAAGDLEDALQRPLGEEDWLLVSPTRHAAQTEARDAG